ncbi:MAG: glycosyltransferase [Cryobacterium sp.]
MRNPSVPQVVAFPYYVDNPYTDLLYGAVRASGYDILAPTKLDQLDRALIDVGAGDVIHIQWTSPIAHVGRDAEDSWRRVAWFQRIVTAAQKRGAALIWTVHNIVPHGTVHLEQELALTRFLIEHADAVHVMNPATTVAVADLYDIPADKTVVIPHCSYLDVYPQSITRAEARAEFGLSATDTVVLFLGQMRPYKGLDVLLPALERAGENRDDLVLLMAGKTIPADADEIQRLIPQNIRVIRQHSHVDDLELQRWLGAADVMALPYRKALNSGSAMLAATFGVPVLLADLPHFRAQFDGEPWVRFFQTDADGNHLETALAEVRPLLHPDADAVRYARSLTPADMATSFQRLLERVRMKALAARTG